MENLRHYQPMSVIDECLVGNDSEMGLVNFEDQL